MIGLNICDRSPMDLSLRKCSFQPRISAQIFFTALSCNGPRSFQPTVSHTRPAINHVLSLLPVDPLERPGAVKGVPAGTASAHQVHLEWTPSRMLNWAATIDPHTAQLLERILGDKPHPEIRYRGCLGIIRLADQ